MELTVTSIMNAYGIHPVQIEKITDSLYKVYDHHYAYALKKSNLSSHQSDHFTHVYHLANEKQLQQILPLYITKQNTLYTIWENKIWYVTAWINGGKPSVDQMYKMLGEIHFRTKRSVTISPEQIVHYFKSYRSTCQQMDKKLLQYVNNFEMVTYMSPFELQVCTHYRDLMIVFKKIGERIEQFIEEYNEQSSWNVSLCHGRLDYSHMIQGHQLYIINLESAYFDHPTKDLVDFFKNEVYEYDCPVDTYIQSFSSYTKMNPLKLGELYYFLTHLLDPSSYISLVDAYTANPYQKSMIEHVEQLQREYRKLLFALEMSRYIEQEYELFLLDENDVDS